MPRHEASSVEAPALSMPVSKRDHLEGSMNAPLTLVEYGDYQCPYCGAAYYEIKRLQETFGDSLRFVYRNFPLTQIHPEAMLAAEAAEEAGLQERFWPMHDTLYENQGELSDENILDWAVGLGVDLDKFQQDAEQGPVKKRIQEDHKSGVRSGVNGTPTFFINGKRYDGPSDFESLQEALQQEQA